MSEREFQPRYVAYSRSKGFADPEECLIADREEYPGGCMCGFIIWIQERWAEWKQKEGLKQFGGFEPVLSDEDHRQFDLWLEELTA